MLYSSFNIRFVLCVCTVLLVQEHMQRLRYMLGFTGDPGLITLILMYTISGVAALYSYTDTLTALGHGGSLFEIRAIG